MHVAETKTEVLDSESQYQMSPLKRLEKLGLLDNQCIFAHCVHVSEADIDIMSRKKASAVYNPESNMKLGVGVAPVPLMLKKGLDVGIGSDSSASNNDLSIFREMDTGTKIQKLYGESTQVMHAYDALTLATSGGARALGLAEKVGTLEEGKEADLILVDLKQPHMRPIHDLVSQLVYSATGAEVDTVICRGKILVSGGKNLVLDEARILEEVDKLGEAIGKHVLLK
jgi:5-methylthioadenosine/S-adenosylhomocysteine deaminase